MNDDVLFDLRRSSGSDDSDEAAELTTLDPAIEPLAKDAACRIIEEEVPASKATVSMAKVFPAGKVDETDSKKPIEEIKSASDEIEIEFVSPSAQIQEPLRLKVHKKTTLLEIKARIAEKHPDKPIPAAQKIIYKGRQLVDDQIVGDLVTAGLSGVIEGSAQAKFHLLIDKSRMAPPVNRTQAVAARVQAQRRLMQVQQPAAAQQAPQQPRQPQRPLTKDEILVTRKYLDYEHRLLDEYRRQTVGIETDQTGKFQKKANRMERAQQRRFHLSHNMHPGHHQEYKVDTNMSPEQNFFMTRLPLMDHGFQERVGIYSAAEKIKANLSDLNENNNAIRLLGYDSILQPLLIMKLCGFMLIFGSQAPGRLKWVVVTLLVTYYFYTVYSLYNDHFEQQRRLLNLNQPNNRQRGQQRDAERQRMRQFLALLADNANVNAQEDRDNAAAAGGAADNRAAVNVQLARRIERLDQVVNLGQQVLQQDNRPGFLGWFYEKLALVCHLAYLFVLSFHHDWIDPVLREFDQQHTDETRLQEAAQQLVQVRNDLRRANQPAPPQAVNEGNAAAQQPPPVVNRDIHVVVQEEEKKQEEVPAPVAPVLLDQTAVKNNTVKEKKEIDVLFEATANDEDDDWEDDDEDEPAHEVVEEVKIDGKEKTD